MIFCVSLHSQKRSGCSAARLAHLLWEQRVPGSNPGTPTGKNGIDVDSVLFCIFANKQAIYV